MNEPLSTSAPAEAPEPACQAARHPPPRPCRSCRAGRPIRGRNGRLRRRDRAAGARRYPLRAQPNGLAGRPQAFRDGHRRYSCRRTGHDAAAHPPRRRYRQRAAIRPDRFAGRLQRHVSIRDDGFPTRCGRRNWRGLPRRSAHGRYSATMIGGTMSPSVRRALRDVRIPILENDAVMLGPEGQRFWLAGLAIRSRIGSARAAFAALTTCRERWRKSERTTPCCCSPTSRTSFHACRRAWR